VNETELRRIAAWNQRLDETKAAEELVTRTRQAAKKAAEDLAAIRKAVQKDCPIDLDELAYRFWSKVLVIDDDSSCWEFRGSRRPVKGEEYGMFRLSQEQKYPIGAHRVSFMLTNGYLPEVGRHTCDNPPCCRPSHIIDGTHADNMRDRHERGRYGPTKEQRGEKNSLAVLTEQIVRESRRLYTEGLSYREIGERFEVPKEAIGFAVRGDTWGHITGPPPVSERRSQGGKLTQVQIREIKALRAAGGSCAAIAERYGVTPSNVSYLTRDKAKAVKRPRRKLTDEEVRSIREMRAKGVPAKDVSIQHNVSVGMVSHIVNGRAYQHVK
jgi:transposase